MLQLGLLMDAAFVLSLPEMQINMLLHVTVTRLLQRTKANEVSI